MNKELKENIMQGTLQAFNQKGLKFTMDDIAKILGISKKTIYQVFRDKEALFLETVDYLFDRIKDSEQKIVENQEMDTLQKIHTILGVMPECYQVSYLVRGEPLVSIVIPNKDHVDDLKKCIDAIEQRSTYRNYEIIIVENNSVQQETFAYYESLVENPHIQVLYWQEEFNYSKINNFGVAHTKGKYILLLNNDTELISPDFITQMLGYCQRKDVGIVGARLYFEDGTIQHAGVIVGIGGIAGHAFSAMDEQAGIYQLRTSVACDYSAVTAACLMISRETFDAVGGLDPEFQVAFNDVDFCLKVRKLGKLVVYVPQAKLYHYESKSRGKEDTVKKQKRFHSEMQLFQSRWVDILATGDPYYNMNLALDAFDFSVRK